MNPAISAVTKLLVQIRKQLNLGWGSAKHPDCAGITPETLLAVNWDDIDLSEWLALLKFQNKLPELNADTLEQLNLEALTGKSSRLDFDQQREDSRKRLEARYNDISVDDLNQFHTRKMEELRLQGN